MLAGCKASQVSEAPLQVRRAPALAISAEAAPGSDNWPAAAERARMSTLASNRRVVLGGFNWLTKRLADISTSARGSDLLS